MIVEYIHSTRLRAPDKFIFELHQEFFKVLRSPKPVVIDLTSTQYIDSAGLAMLLLGDERRKDFFVLNPCRAVANILTVCSDGSKLKVIRQVIFRDQCPIAMYNSEKH